MCIRMYKPYHNVVQKQVKANRGKWSRFFKELVFNMWLLTEFRFNFVEISYSGLQTQYLTEVQL